MITGMLAHHQAMARNLQETSGYKLTKGGTVIENE
jgi:hypothetical protein